MKRFYLLTGFFVFLLMSFSHAQRVVSEKSEATTTGGTKITRVTADDLGVETVTIDELDKNTNLIRRRVITKRIDGDKVLTVTTDSVYSRSFLRETKTIIYDQNGNFVYGELFSFDKDGYKTSGAKASPTATGDYLMHRYDERSGNWGDETIWKKKDFEYSYPQLKADTSYNLPFPETRQDAPPTTNVIGMGVKGGVNLATVSVGDEAAEDPTTSIGFYAGAYVNFPVSGSFRFQPELIFSRQGCKSEINVGSSNLEDKLTLNYIAVPLMAQLQTSGGFFVEAGPQFAFLISAKYEVDGDEFDLLEEDVMNKIDFGINGGLGYVSKSGLGVHLRYNLGLSNIWKDDNGEAKNRVFSAGIHYHFRK